MRITWIGFKQLDKSTNHSTETEMIRLIHERGCDISYFCGYRSKKRYYGLNSDQIRYLSVPRIKGIRSLFFLFKISRVVIGTLFFKRTDVLLIDYMTNLALAPILCLFRLLRPQIKIVMDIRTLPVNPRRFLYEIHLFFLSLRLTDWTCDGVTFITSFMRKYCLERVPLKYVRTEVWNSGFNRKLFDPNMYQRVARNRDFELFYHGGITMSRGIGSLIRAVRILRDRGYPMILKMLGNIVNSEEIHSIIAELGMEEECHVFPPVPYSDIPQFICNTDLPIIPLPDFIGWRVSCPIKLTEYLAMGKCMVLTDIEAHRDVADSLPFAYFAPTSNPEHLADAIERAYRERDKFEDKGRIARSRAVEFYTWERQAEILISFMKTLMPS